MSRLTRGHIHNLVCYHNFSYRRQPGVPCTAKNADSPLYIRIFPHPSWSGSPDSQILNGLLSELLDLFNEGFSAVPILNGCIDICGGTNVRIVKHGDHRKDDALNTEDGSPSLIGSLS